MVGVVWAGRELPGRKVIWEKTPPLRMARPFFSEKRTR